MQSDTFLNDTDSDDEEYSSDSSGDLPKNNNIGVLYEFPNKDIVGERFADQSLISEYEHMKKNNDTTDGIIEDHEDRILDLSFQSPKKVMLIL